jgi:hypothetical protein
MSQAYSVWDMLRVIPYVFVAVLVLWGIVDAYRCWTWKHKNLGGKRKW